MDSVTDIDIKQQCAAQVLPEEQHQALLSI